MKTGVVNEVVWTFKTVAHDNISREGTPHSTEVQYATIMEKFRDHTVTKLIHVSLDVGCVLRDLSLGKERVECSAAHTMNVVFRCGEDRQPVVESRLVVL
jgi:hypothetical protein